MVNKTPPAELDINPQLISKLLLTQHPDLAALPLVLADQGWDNVMYRLGDDLVLRLPKRQVSAQLILNEQQWLPSLAKNLPIPISAPIRVGCAQDDYPWAWSVLPWIEGATANVEPLADDQAELFADFLRALHQRAPNNAPENLFRGVPLQHREAAIGDMIIQLRGQTNLLSADLLDLWQQALSAEIDLPTLWLHGDLHARNVLVNRGKLAAVIDWGDITSGDIATDLAAVWLLFDSASARQQVLARYQASDATVLRAKGWALLFGIVLLNTGLVDHPQHAAMGRQTLQRLEQDL